MRRMLLNLAALRRADDRHAEAEPQTSQRPDDRPTLTINRRHVLGAASAAAFGLTPTLRALGASVGSGWEVRGDERRVAFLIDGEERWSIDPRRFAGSPKLQLEQTEGFVGLRLSGARYPGTDLSADMRCDIRRGLTGWRMTIDMPFGRFHSSVSFERWLAGYEPARSVVSLDANACSLGAVAAVRLAGTAAARFHPNWTMEVEGDRVATVIGMGEALPSNRFELSLPSDSEQAIVARPASRRTSLSMERGEHEWALLPKGNERWRFASAGSAFDSIRIDASESSAGNRKHGLVAEGTGKERRLEVTPFPGIIGDGGRPSGIPLHQPRYAVGFDGDQEEHALVSPFGDSVWIYSKGIGVEVGGGDNVDPLTLVLRDGKVEQLDCAPAIRSTYLPMPDVIVEPMAVPDGSRLRFIPEWELAPAPADASYLNLAPGPDDPPTMMVGVGGAHAIRPKDLLHLRFTFQGLGVSTSGSKPRLTREGASVAYLLVGFPPQNIAEEAFFEADPNVPAKPKFPGDTSAEEPPVTPKGSTSGTPILPVKVRAAGQSQIAFNVPSSFSSTDLTLEALLAAMSEWEMNLVDTALPQEAPTVKGIATLDALPKRIFAPTPTKVPKLVGGRVVPLSDAEARSVKVRGGTSYRVPATYSKYGSGEAKVSQITAYKQGLELSPKLKYDTIAPLLKMLPELRAPSRFETKIEAPFRLIISPNRFGAWAHALTEVTHEGRTELWHTRLGIRVDDGIDEVGHELERTIRAVWTEDQGFTKDPLNSFPHYNSSDPHTDSTNALNPFRMSLDPFDRHNIVHLSANYRIKMDVSNNIAPSGKAYKPKPVKVDRLMLSSLGAWMNVRGAWDEAPRELAVEEWRHRAAWGRDNYVRVVYKGYLWPFGHKASLVKITERKLVPSKFGNIAYLRQRMFIIVRQPEMSFRSTQYYIKGDTLNNPVPTVLRGTPGGNDLWIDRQMPFHLVRITTTVTPNIDKPDDNASQVVGSIKNYGQTAFTPRVGGQDFRFHIVMEDTDNQRVELAMPLVFIESTISNEYDQLVDIKTQYDKNSYDSRHTIGANGQKIAYGKTDRTGDTTFETESVTWTAYVPKKPDVVMIGDEPRFTPAVVKSKLSIPAIKHIANNTQATEFKFNQTFLKAGFNEAVNKGGMLLDVASTAIGLSYDTQGDRSGGLVKPNMSISGLSKQLGPIAGDVSKVANGDFDPGSFFPKGGGLGAKIFGVFDLMEIVQGVAGATGLDKMLTVPKFVTEAMSMVEGFYNDIQQLQAKLEKALGDGSVLPGDLKTKATSLNVNMKDLIGAINGLLSDPSKAVSTIVNTVDDFAINLIAFGSQLLKDADKIQDTLRKELLDRFGSLEKIVGVAKQALIDQLKARLNEMIAKVTGDVQAMINKAQADADAQVAAAKAKASVVAAKIPILQNDLTDAISKADTFASSPVSPATVQNLLNSVNKFLGDFQGLVGAVQEMKTLAPANYFGSVVSNVTTFLNGLTAAVGVVQEMLKKASSAVDSFGAFLDLVEKFAKAYEMIKEMKVKFDWQPALKNFPDTSDPIFITKNTKAPGGSKDAILLLAIEVKAKTEGKEGVNPGASILCSLTNFAIDLIAPVRFIKLYFNKIEFSASTSKKPDVDVDIAYIEFTGPLSFIEALRSLIPLDGFSDPPALDISAKGIVATFSLALPNVAFGVFSLQNLSLGAGFCLPFIGDPLSVSFNFCTRESPFLLTVSMFGGGGFFGITIDPGGVHILEASFEFGASISLNFGVASGGVHVMAGIYFKMVNNPDPTPDECSLTGYVRIGGEVDVLGLISCSIELNLSLTYDFVSGKCKGKAVLTIEVEVLFFSASVEIEAERQFAGSNGDPSFAQLMEPYEYTPDRMKPSETVKVDPWKEYSDAFWYK